jgi:hypothetical protein
MLAVVTFSGRDDEDTIVGELLTELGSANISHTRARPTRPGTEPVDLLKPHRMSPQLPGARAS